MLVLLALIKAWSAEHISAADCVIKEIVFMLTMYFYPISHTFRLQITSRSPGGIKIQKKINLWREIFACAKASEKLLVEATMKKKSEKKNYRKNSSDVIVW